MSGIDPIPQVLSYQGVRAINPPSTVVAKRNPNSNDKKYPIGTLWVNTSAQDSFQLVAFSSGAPVWTSLGGGSVEVSTLTGNTGGAISPTAGNINILGTANQITTVGSGSTITASLIGPYTPATYTAHGVLIGEGTSSIAATAAGSTGQTLMGATGADPAFTSSPSFAGSVTAATTITATSGAITATNGNFVASTSGTGLLLTPVVTSGTTTATANGRSGQITITTPTINAGSTFAMTITNSSVTGSGTVILYGLTGGTTGAAITIQSVANTASQSVVTVMNASAVTNSTGSLVLTFLVLN